MSEMFLSRLVESSAISNEVRTEAPLGAYTVFPLPNGNPNEYAIVNALTEESAFNVSVAVKETPKHLYLNPYDLMADDNQTISLADIIAGDGDELQKGDSVFGQTYKYVFSSDDKDLIDEIVETSSYSIGEVFSFLVEFLEDLQFIPNPQRGFREIKPEDLMKVFQTLIPKYSTDRIIQTLMCANTEEKFLIMKAKSSDQIISAFKTITI